MLKRTAIHALPMSDPALADAPSCDADAHTGARRAISVSPLVLERAAAIFRAAGEPARLRLLARLAGEEACVSEIAVELAEGMSTVSQRLRLLRAEGLIGRRREGKHVYYFLADDHVRDLIATALDHAGHIGHFADDE
jgi:ArsR family transcriptional regulator, lead/cadmium/zinc/bismuth-responsive transcriptional repressor